MSVNVEASSRLKLLALRRGGVYGIASRVLREATHDPTQAHDTVRSLILRQRFWGLIIGFTAGFAVATVVYLATLYVL